jgi:hypothetical protein
MSSLNQAIIRDIMTKMPLPTEDYNPDQPTEGRNKLSPKKSCPTGLPYKFPILEYDPSEPSEEVPKQPTYAYTPLTAVNRAQVFKYAITIN